MAARARGAGAARAAAVTVPMLAAVAVLGWWAADEGGYPVAVWAPGGIVLAALLTIAAALVPLRVEGVPRAVVVAIAALAAFTAWSFASIGWADDRGAALEGANRTLVYLLVFGLFALWRQRAASGAVVLGAWTLAVVAVAVLTAYDPAYVAPGRFSVTLPRAVRGARVVVSQPWTRLHATTTV